MTWYLKYMCIKNIELWNKMTKWRICFQCVGYLYKVTHLRILESLISM
jgi:hypothetical protein